jgi:hypothetical protein
MNHPTDEDLAARAPQPASAKLRRLSPNRKEERRTMKYLCFGYYDKGKFDGMTGASLVHRR